MSKTIQELAKEAGLHANPYVEKFERMNVKKKEYTIEFDTQGGSSILGRFIRILLFPFVFVLTGKAKL